MKKSIIYLMSFSLFFVFAIIFLGGVKAEGEKIYIYLDCPNNFKMNANKTMTCSLYAVAYDEDATIKNVKAVVDYPLSNARVKLNTTKVKTGDDVKVGTVVVSSSNHGGKGNISIVLDAYYQNSDPEYGVELDETITVTSTVNTLNDLKIDGATIPGFSKENTNYTFETTKSKVSISAAKTNSKSKVTGTGTKVLICGNNNQTIIVKSESGTTKTYTVNIKRKCNTSANLKGITVSKGTLTPSFKENIYNYTVLLGKSDDKITIKGKKGNDNQTITGEVTDKEVSMGNTDINLVVVNKSGETKTYTITLIKSENDINSSMLRALSLSNGKIDFKQDTLEYSTKVLYEVEKIEVLATPESENSTVTIKGNDKLKVGNNQIIINVANKNGKKTDYKINVKRLAVGETLGDNPNIKDIKVEGYNLPFDYDRKDYKLVIKNEDKINILVTMDDPSASYEIKGNENLKDGSIIEIITKSLNGDSKKYTIEITKSSYTIYYIIGGLLVLIAILIPVLVYFKSVKKKKVNTDVNGYKIDSNVSENKRKVITQNNNIQNNSVLDNKQIHSINNNDNVNNNMNNSNNNNDKQNIEKTSVNEEDFDAGLQDYVPTENKSANKCPACGREILGNPSECPYCKVKLK